MAAPEQQAAASPLASGSPVRRWLPWALLAVVVVTCLSIAAFGTRSAPTAQDRVTNIARTVKCPFCNGESAAESNSPASQEIRAEAARRVQIGESDDEIRAYFASKWGQEILLTPSASGVNVLIWVLPVVALAMAVGFLVIVFRRWSTAPTAHASDADKALVAEALAREHDEAATDDDPHGEGSSR
jgi:cytochrome c-type biogenesis protein CcmH